MKNNIDAIVNDIKKITAELFLSGIYDGQINIMEVCGTHTMAIAKNGLLQLLPDEINLVSGPGCPVCVTSASDIDHILEIIKNYEIVTYTFGDLMRVPGTFASLITEKSRGKEIKVCYSPSDALEYAENNPDKNIMFIAIGFETTAPITAVLAQRACRNNVNNFFIYSVHKIIPPALEALLSDPGTNIHGFLMPGHVSVITGSSIYNFVAEKYNTPAVISGFEPADILKSILIILKQLHRKESGVAIEYTRVVKPEGNTLALKLMNNVFETKDCLWRGLGIIGKSGLKLRKPYDSMDAEKAFAVASIESIEAPGCECGNILKGIKKPADCKMFSIRCTPGNPLGPCMVSSEGACAAFFRYGRLNDKR